MSKYPEHATDKIARWWPYFVGIFGMCLITFDAIIFPPPDTITVGAGVGCIVGFGAVKLIRFDRANNGD